MGIPSYFSYIVKNHGSIIRRYLKSDMQIDNFFMDCNSIIYDIVNSMKTPVVADADIIKAVIAKIEEYIAIISPKAITYIAFDGVAPVAKMEQQRCRRYKSAYQSEYSSVLLKQERKWNTSAITPGTQFMDELNRAITAHFAKENVIVSGSDAFGEGEHKLFEYIRTSPAITKESVNVIYGLDSDLIMLSINHLPINSNIYLFRETPEFIKSIDKTLEPNETYMMDIPLLAEIIGENMGGGPVNRVYDYIFLCFFLGNDFMPHFPALNIRTGGVDKMISAYRETVGKTKNVLTDGSVIYWKHVFTLVKYLASLEEEYIQKEMKLRDRREKFYYPEDTPEQELKKFEAIPTYERGAEHFMNPFEKGWEKRYYISIVGCKITKELREKICVNYLEGLEWTMKYYTQGCPDYRWKYEFNYPPLLVDLMRYIPQHEKEFITLSRPPVSPLVQLCYVLPRKSHSLLPKEIRAKLDPTLYPIDCKFIWAFCQYFWESHVELPEIDLEKLEKVIEGV